MKNKRFIIFMAIVVAILLIPLIAMQFTNEVDWNIFDFIVMGILLTGTAYATDLVIRKVKDKEFRVIIIAGILFTLFLIWVELAVGLFGTPFAGS